MGKKLSIFPYQKEELFHTELVNCGVKYEQAQRAAKILASEQPDEVLTQEEIQMVKEVCREWLVYQKRWASLMAKPKLR